MLIAYIEDEKELSDLLTKYMHREGYDVIQFHNGEDALKQIKNLHVDLWVLDVMLPGKIDGYDLINQIRNYNPAALVLFTSARDSDIDKISGLEMGANDYLAKPFSPREFILRINNLLQRVLKPLDRIEHIYNYEINLTKKLVFSQGIEIEKTLTFKEFELLEFLIENKNKDLKREEIMKKIWPEGDANERAVDDLLRRLRHKMPNIRVITVYGKGYKFLD